MLYFMRIATGASSMLDHSAYQQVQKWNSKGYWTQEYMEREGNKITALLSEK